MDLFKFPPSILYKIFFKMGNTEIVRMRRTCSTMNAFIDENKEKLSSRSELGLYLGVVIDRNEPEKTVVVHGNTALNYEDDLSSMFSAVAITNLALRIQMETRSVEQIQQLEDDVTLQISLKLLEFIKSVKISCDMLQIHNFPAAVAVQVADYVNPRKRSFIDYKGLEVSEYFTLLGTSKNCASFSVAFLGLELDPQLFEKAKKLNAIYANPMTHAVFRSFLWEICRTTDHGNLFELHCLTEKRIENRDFRFDDPDYPMPDFRIIWDKSTMPQEFCNTKMPDCIRIFKQLDTTVIYVEERFEEGVEMVVYITRNNEQFLSCIVYDFCDMDMKLPDHFTTSTEEEQMVLLRNVFLAAKNFVV